MWRPAFVISILTVAPALPAAAQNCTPDTISLTTQAEVDNFQADHGPCTHVVGTLSVSGPDIVDLDGLSGLTSIGSSFAVQSNAALPEVDLPALTTVGDDLSVTSNGALTRFALPGLTAVGVAGFLPGNVFVFNNDALTALELPGLVSIRRELEVSQNDALPSVDLPELTTLRTVRIEENPSLADVDLPSVEDLDGNLLIQENPALASVGLASLATVDGRFSIFESGPLTELVFPQLTRVFDSLGFSGHPNLRLVDLPSLERAATHPINSPVFGLLSNPSLETLNLPRLNQVRFLQIDDCDALSSLDLPSLEEILSVAFITGNAELRSISMPAVTFVASKLLIAGNPNLSECCGLLPALRPGVAPPSVILSGNATGCNSVGEIEGLCLVQIPTASPFGLVLLAILLAAAGFAAVRRTSSAPGR